MNLTAHSADVLVVDDEADIRELIELSLLRMGLSCDGAATLGEARALLAQHSYRLCLTDMRLPDGDGLELVEHIQAQRPGLPVAVITAFGSMDAAIRAMKLGAFDFVTKPLELKTLRTLIAQALKPVTGTLAEAPASRALIGDSPALSQLRVQIAKLARSQAPVFIHGESGTGKEVIARCIHELGPRAGQPFVAVNCGAIAPELFESELFGHRKGAFTGAASDKLGLFQAANGGTLFLDEVAELPLTMQVKLLRAIQERAVRPVGANHEESVDVRILSASHRNLAQRVAEGSFRQDLYYRINVIELDVPPLRERIEDIPALAEHILARLAARDQCPPHRLSPAALARLQSMPLPGNVRELENLLERACALCEHTLIEPDDLGPPSVLTAAPESASAASVAVEPQPDALALLASTDWDRDAVACRLGLSRRQLDFRLHKWGLQ